MNTGKPFIVNLETCTLPNGKVKTLPVVEQNLGEFIEIPKNMNEILLKLEASYDQLIKKWNPSKVHQFQKFASNFMMQTDRFNIKLKGLGISLVKDLNLSIYEVREYLYHIPSIKNMIDYIAKEYKKMNKKDPIKYAETVKEFVDLVGGYNEAIEVMAKEIKMKESTVRALCKVSDMPKKIKTLILNGKIQLTTAFEIPSIDEEKQIEIAKTIKGLSYKEAKEKLTRIKTNL